MTKEDKALLLKDLCARLPYNVKCKVHLDTKGYCLRDKDKYCDDILESVNYEKQTCTFNKSIGYNFGYFSIEEVKPYLRPMSSMTEEERNNLRAYCRTQEGIIYDVGVSGAINSSAIIDFLNSHHFDYRGLIPMGLALEAPEGMYNIKEK